MKFKGLLLLLVVTTVLFAGCATKAPGGTTTTTTTAAQTTTTTAAGGDDADVVTTASIVNEPQAFLDAAGKDGTWIICTLEDMTIDKDILVEGEFTYREIIQRKIALYTQDDQRNVTARFKLTAPKMIVRSVNTKIQSGTFIGDVYVEAKDFNLVDATIEGNVYFASEDLKATFKLDEKSKVTGATEVKAAQ